MSDDLETRKNDLAEKLSKARKTESEDKDTGDSSTGTGAGMAQAFKLSSEFIAAVGVGFALGWGLDSVAGTSPFGIIVFLILGFCAGVVNVMRASGAMAPARGTQERQLFERSQNRSETKE